MSGTFHICNLRGMALRVHFTWILIIGLLAWTLAELYFPSRYPDWNARMYWGVAIISAPALFFCVLIHELGHVVEALRCRIFTRRITLFFIGNFLELSRQPRSATDEIRIAMGGPLTNGMAAAAYAVVYLITRNLVEEVGAAFECLALLNLSVALVNLIPASPLDGGRILRALVWKATGSEENGTQAAAISGLALGFAMIAAGIYFAFADNVFAGAWLVFGGWFMQSTASSIRREPTADDRREIVTGRKVREAMDEGVRAVPPGTSVQSLVENHAAERFERAYLVTLGDTLQGLVTLTDVARVPAEQRPLRWVSEIMTRAPDLITLDPDAPLEDGLDILAASDIKQIVVMKDGEPVGLLTREGVVRVMEVALLLPLQVGDEGEDDEGGRG